MSFHGSVLVGIHPSRHFEELHGMALGGEEVEVFQLVHGNLAIGVLVHQGEQLS